MIKRIVLLFTIWLSFVLAFEMSWVEGTVSGITAVLSALAIHAWSRRRSRSALSRGSAGHGG